MTHYNVPPAPPYGYGQPTPKRGWSTGKILLVALTAVLVFCGGGSLLIMGTIGGAATVIEQESNDRKGDVKITSCERTIISTFEAAYTITNTAKVPRDYIIEVEAVDAAGTRLGVANGFESGVPAGGSAKGTAAGMIADKVKFSCRLTGA